MVDPRSSADEPDDAADATDPADGEGDVRESPPGGATDDDSSLDELRAQVEEKYDFDDFGPEDMARMSAEEWEAVFDPETWITGPELLDRVEADLKNRIADRDVFARLERFSEPDRVVAYSDEGYAVVSLDGSVEGTGTVLRDVKPTVALCSMDDYEVPDPPEGETLPRPLDVPEGSGELGNRMLQIVGGVQLLMALFMFASVPLFGVDVLLAVTVGFGLLVIGGLLFLIVANARLSDRFRAEEYRNRLRAIGLDSDERPAFLDEIERGRLPDPGEERSDTDSGENAA
ncbi:DUF7319 domain-containing protein [Halomarina pelagica]|uniref:DUF7319 domain-containing protein n=1 Tax=Halomarina pelagica TaxID=2961599 RepID=UPI0020C2375D|nr:hypothetical protein [Halomarina sp. BND7]